MNRTCETMMVSNANASEGNIPMLINERKFYGGEIDIKGTACL